ncbi:hypothetical protein NE237_027403 [Protea cynaroides]|uniref:Uncharacterized protein n=1 Tax=Protea cynaroides TaxID=273540 RepID=A0A9Q0GMG9_9MAGN|nr:hypothetical protein NE237_027403 [Protea cynaroides]
MGNFLTVRREVYVSDSFSNLLTPDSVMVPFSKFLTSQGVSHILNSKGFSIGNSNDNTFPLLLNSEEIFAYLSSMGMNGQYFFPTDIIVFEVSGAATIKEANHKRELRFEPRKQVKGRFTIPMGALKIHENRETKLDFRDSTVVAAGLAKDHILWTTPECFNAYSLIPEEYLVDVSDLVLLRVFDHLGNKEEIKSVLPGVFIITWITIEKIWTSRHVRFQPGSHGSFEIHPECNCSKLSQEGSGEEGKIGIQNVHDGSLKLIFPVAVILSVSVKPGGGVTLIRWRRNDDDMNSIDRKKPINQASLPGKATSGSSFLNQTFNIILSSAVKNCHLFGNQSILANLYDTGRGATANVGSITSANFKRERGKDMDNVDEE